MASALPPASSRRIGTCGGGGWGGSERRRKWVFGILERCHAEWPCACGTWPLSMTVPRVGVRESVIGCLGGLHTKSERIMTNKPGGEFIPPRPAQQGQDPPPIPVAIPYFSDAEPSMLPLVRVLAVLIVITAALKLISVPTFILRSMPLGSSFADWYGWYPVLFYFF